jgi:predicted PurR-regulated permease PerM
MKENTIWQRWMYRDNLWGLLLRLAAIAGVIYLLVRASAVFSAFVAALILAQIAAPIVNWICKFRIPKVSLHTQKAVAVLLTFVLIGFGIYLMVHFFIQPFKQEWTEFMANKDRNMAALQDKWADIQEKIKELQEWWNNKVPPEVRNFFVKPAGEQKGPGMGSEITQSITHFLGETTKSVGHIVELILLPVLAFYFIVEGHALRKELLLFFPRNRTRQVIAMLEEGGSVMQNYLKAQVFLAVIAGLITFTLLSIFSVPYAFTLGLIAGVTRAVPVIGPLLGGIPVVGVALLQTERPWLWIVILVMFTVLHLFESKILMPKLIGHHLDLHAVVIILALLIGGEFFGLGGMFLAAPLAALARTLYIHYIVKPWERPNAPKRRRTRLERAIRNAKPQTLSETPS